MFYTPSQKKKVIIKYPYFLNETREIEYPIKFTVTYVSDKASRDNEKKNCREKYYF